MFPGLPVAVGHTHTHTHTHNLWFPADSPPRSTSTLTSLPTGRSLRMSTTWAWLSVCTFCRLISLMTSPFSKPAAPLAVQDHLHLLAQRAVGDGEAETPGAFHQRHAHQLRLQHGGVGALLREVVVVLVVGVVVVAASVGHGSRRSRLPGQGSPVWDGVVRVLRRGAGGDGEASLEVPGPEVSSLLLESSGSG